MKYTIDDIKEILECAMGEVETYIPSEAIEEIIEYLNKYEEMKINESWRLYPDPFY